MTSRILPPLVALALTLSVSACGGSGDSPDSGHSEKSEKTEQGLTAAELEHGVGPVSAMSLDPVDPELAARGEQVFQTKCSACHKMDTRYVGPPLGDVTDRRSPAFIMNMILNPEGMIKEHPEAKKLYAEYMTPMANQNLSRDEARAILEFLRTQAPNQ